MLSQYQSGLDTPLPPASAKETRHGLHKPGSILKRPDSLLSKKDDTMSPDIVLVLDCGERTRLPPVPTRDEAAELVVLQERLNRRRRRLMSGKRNTKHNYAKVESLVEARAHIPLLSLTSVLGRVLLAVPVTRC